LCLWYKRDNTFWVPKGHAYIVLKSWVIKYSLMSRACQLRIPHTVRWRKQPHDMHYSQGIPVSSDGFLILTRNPTGWSQILCAIAWMRSPIAHHSQDWSIRSIITPKDSLSVFTDTRTSFPSSCGSFSKILRIYSPERTV